MRGCRNVRCTEVEGSGWGVSIIVGFWIGVTCSMAEAGENRDVKERCPQVFVVDSKALGVPAAVKLDGHHLSLIYLLLGVALLGVFIEAGLIYHLYNRLTAPSDRPIHNVEYMKAENNSFLNKPHEHNEILPEKLPEDVRKPAAFLQKHGALRWTRNIFPTFVTGLQLMNNSLYIQEDGCYYIFSKMSFLENCSLVKHQVMYITGRYSGTIELMKSSRYLCNNHKDQSMPERGNSYLGGIFNLVKGDSVFVQVNNLSLVYGEASENFFGAFKIH
ncbi:tumor necrosis factor ligand superfamily member 6 isoform X2 [Triplophysa rosa]|uniref:tumor necrosis factor ligand superfamily member 6 isoform X2 n=1 Tax=Triplophysa rosa TaxID=992332 RepID=UPI0025462984|nr:tumor necrosis factor ligand superfamily member 6 isoform X2 [Triplophysa rosa]